MNAPSDTIAVAKPLMDEREIEAVSRVILSGWVTQGPEVAAFEREFSAFVGSRHACAVSNCTTALHLALRGAGVGPGDEVITVSHSFIATANAVRYCGAVPVFVDIERTGYNIDPELIEGALSARTKAILVVHQLGMPCDLTRLVDLARRHSIRLIEDAACAIGSEVNLGDGWQKIGIAARGHRLFFVSSAQGRHHGRRGNDHDERCRAGQKVPSLASARDERI